MKQLVVALVLVLLWACSGGEEKVNYRLTSKERREVDTLVVKQVAELRTYMDSVCSAEFDERVGRITDSLVQERLEDELRLRSRIPLRGGEK
jgi:hypothetical protein